MAIYTRKFYDIRDMSATGAGIIKDGPDAAGFTTYTGKSFSWDPDTSSTPASNVIQITDDDGILGGTADATQQTLATPLLGDNMTLADGTAIMASYSYTFIVGGVTHYIYAIQTTGSNNVIGFVSTFDLVPGVNYAITGANNTPNANYASLICFASGTMIDTDRGPVAVEDLAPGDLVRTRDAGLQSVRWINARELDAGELAVAPQLRPIRIRAGALGNDTPSTDLLVSPQHRVLIRSAIAQRMFGAPEVLVAAKQLLQIDGIDIAEDVDSVTYVHFLFDDHQIVFSNGAETESLHTGPEAIRSVGAAAREEIFALFPELADEDYAPAAARMLASGRMGRKLAVRHIQNGKPLVG